MLQELLNGFGRNVGTWKYCLAKKSFVSRWQFHEGFVLPILFSFQFSSNQFRLFKTKPAKGEKACLFFQQSKSNETYARIISLVFQLYSSLFYQHCYFTETSAFRRCYSGFLEQDFSYHLWKPKDAERHRKEGKK